MRGRHLVVTVCVVAAMAVTPGRASGVAIRVVDDDGKATAADCNASTAASTSIQGPLSASADGDVVKVCPGSYAGFLVPLGLDKIKIRGAMAGTSGVTRTGTGGGESIITSAVQIDSRGVVLDGFTFTTTSSPHVHMRDVSRGNTLLNNVHLGGTNANPLVSPESQGTGDKNIIKRSRFIDGNYAIAHATTSPGNIGKVTIASNRFEGQAAAAISNLSGESATVTGNTFIDLETGIFARDGAGTYEITSNKFRRTAAFTGFQNGIYVGDYPVVLVANNTFNDWRGLGIYVQPDATGSVVIKYNRWEKGRNFAIVVDSEGGNIRVESNKLRGTGPAEASVGIGAAEATSGDTYLANDVSGYGTDCSDGSTGGLSKGTANTWTNNIGFTSSPRGICKPPA